MWKRDNEAPAAAPPVPAPPTPPSAGAARREVDPTRSPRSPQGAAPRAAVGAAIVVRGELTGDEDLVIEGRFEGRIELPKNAVTIAATGHVAAEVRASTVVVEGEVQGNLVAAEEIILRRSARVRGDLLSPRVTIEDGARFKGSIDMDASLPTASSAALAAPAEAPSDGDPFTSSLAAADGVSS